jgi:hypothetical protein
VPSFRIEYEGSQDQRLVHGENQHRAIETFIAERSWDELTPCTESHYKGWSKVSVCVSPPVVCSHCGSTERRIVTGDTGHEESYEDLCGACLGAFELERKKQAAGVDAEGNEE